MPEIKKGAAETLTDEDIGPTALSRRSLLAQIGVVLATAGTAAIAAAPMSIEAQAADDDDDDEPKPGTPPKPRKPDDDDGE